MPVFLSSTCSDRLELHNNNWASWILHPGPSESDVYSDVVQEAQWNDLLHTARLLIRLDTPLHGNNARGTKYAVYYASRVMHTVFENIKMAALRAMSEEKSCSPFPCFFIPCLNLNAGVILLLCCMRISVSWGHERLADKSITKRYPKRAILFHSWKKFNFKSFSRTWHMILLVIWKRSTWAFIAKQWRLSLNGNAAAHCSAMKKR